ncbi:MAG: AAA family ATPase [Bacteroidaceae bacterium]|nr:AAA family ATPase [Bacteroidaceae bacterium]
MKLERVVINKFWGKYNLDLHLDSDVNILTGANGSGKTTILDIIITLLANNTNMYCQDLYDSATLFLSGNGIIKSITKKGKKEVTFSLNGKKVNYSDLMRELGFVSVSTFDSPMMPIEALQKMKEKYSWLRSELDFELNESLNEYNKFKAALLGQVREMMDGEEPDIKKMRKITLNLNNLNNVANNLFGPKKAFNDKDGEIFFILNDKEGTKITLDKLSSGEKQLLILLFSTVIQNNDDYITFWDEPEVSLHIEWQRKLIRVIRQLNPNMQLIIATHSPSILFEGWEERVLNIEDYLKDE